MVALNPAADKKEKANIGMYFLGFGGRIVRCYIPSFGRKTQGCNC